MPIPNFSPKDYWKKRINEVLGVVSSFYYLFIDTFIVLLLLLFLRLCTARLIIISGVNLLQRWTFS